MKGSHVELAPRYRLGLANGRKIHIIEHAPAWRPYTSADDPGTGYNEIAGYEWGMRALCGVPAIFGGFSRPTKKEARDLGARCRSCLKAATAKGVQLVGAEVSR